MIVPEMIYGMQTGGNRGVTFRGAVGSGDNTEQFQNFKGVQTVPKKMDNFTAW